MTGFWRGLIYSSVAGISTVLGAMPFLLFNKVASQKLIDAFLGFAAGVMLAASAFSLVVPSIELGGVLRFTIGFVLGGILVDVMDKILPHEHFTKGHEGIDAKRLKTIWLFIIAITIHNLPEGMAVGVGGFTPQALTIAIAIGLQNIPEGAAVAASLMSAKYKILHLLHHPFHKCGGGAGRTVGGDTDKFCERSAAIPARVGCGSNDIRDK